MYYYIGNNQVFNIIESSYLVILLELRRHHHLSSLLLSFFSFSLFFWKGSVWLDPDRVAELRQHWPQIWGRTDRSHSDQYCDRLLISWVKMISLISLECGSLCFKTVFFSIKRWIIWLIAAEATLCHVMHAGKYWSSSDFKGVNDEGNENFDKQHQI